MSLISCCQPDFPWACGTGLEAETRDPCPHCAERIREEVGPWLLLYPVSYPTPACIFFPWLFLVM